MAVVKGVGEGEGEAEESRVNDWMEEMGSTWCVGVGGEVAIATRFVRGQAVKRVPSIVGWEGMLVVRRMLVEERRRC